MWAQWSSFWDTEKYSLFTCVYEDWTDEDGRDTDTLKIIKGGCPPNEFPPGTDRSMNVDFIAKDWVEFNKVLLEKYGIDPSLVKRWEHRTEDRECCFECSVPCEHYGNTKEYTLIDDIPILDPNELLKGSVGDYKNLQKWLVEVAEKTAGSTYDVKDLDVVNGASLLVYGMVGSVDYMKQVWEIGADEADDKGFEIMMWFLTGVFALVPPWVFAGAGTALLRNLSMATQLVKALNQGRQIVETLGWVTSTSLGKSLIPVIRPGVFVSKNSDTWLAIANVANGMTAEDIKSLGSAFAEGMAKIQKRRWTG